MSRTFWHITFYKKKKNVYATRIFIAIILSNLAQGNIQKYKVEKKNSLKEAVYQTL